MGQAMLGEPKPPGGGKLEVRAGGLTGGCRVKDLHRETHTRTPPKGVCACLVSLMTCMTLMRGCRVGRVSLAVAPEDNGQFAEEHSFLDA